MKVKEIKFIADTGTEISMYIPDGYEVSLFQNIEKLNFELQSFVGAFPLPKSYTAIMVVPKNVNTGNILKAIDKAIN